MSLLQPSIFYALKHYRVDAVTCLGDEIRDLCSRKLEKIRDERGWTDSPVVMNLDLW